MRRNKFKNALIVFIAVLLTLLMLEVVIRLGGRTNADGSFTFRRFTLEPLELPVDELRNKLKEYLANEDIAITIYDERLGWTYRPNAISRNGSLTINGAGIRSTREYGKTPAADTLRIAIFGDSFTAGMEVRDDEAWGYILELALIDAGIQAEVLNFGVGAYGMDQAFLRWQRLGKEFSPDIVVFGLQPKNLRRNVNVFRPLYVRVTGTPLSKPRYILRGGNLELVNSPPVPPEELIAIYEDFGAHPLSAYEYHYAGRYRFSQWWSFSMLARLLHQVLWQPILNSRLYPDGELEQLGKAIIDAFAKDVAEADASFVIAHLPNRQNLIAHREGTKQSHWDLLDYLEQTYLYVPTETFLGTEFIDIRKWGEGLHYGPEINQIVGEVVADEIIRCIEEAVCTLPRFTGAEAAFRVNPTADA